jgi:chorismate mutase
VPVRLATTCDADTPSAIAEAVAELIHCFHDRNPRARDAVKLVFFTATSDLRSAKPALAARRNGWAEAQFLCLAEMPTDDDLPRCLRALVYVDCEKLSSALVPVYLRGATALRPDLASE